MDVKFRFESIRIQIFWLQHIQFISKSNWSLPSLELVGGSSSNSFRGNSFSSHDSKYLISDKSKSYCRTIKIRVENNLESHRQALTQQWRPQVPASPFLAFMKRSSTKLACTPLQTWQGLSPQHWHPFIFLDFHNTHSLWSMWFVCRMYSICITLATYSMTCNFFDQPNMHLRYCTPWNIQSCYCISPLDI